MQPNLGILPMFDSDPDWTPLLNGLVRRRGVPRMDHASNLSRDVTTQKFPDASALYAHAERSEQFDFSADAGRFTVPETAFRNPAQLVYAFRITSLNRAEGPPAEGWQRA